MLKRILPIEQPCSITVDFIRYRRRCDTSHAIFPLRLRQTYDLVGDLVGAVKRLTVASPVSQWSRLTPMATRRLLLSLVAMGLVLLGSACGPASSTTSGSANARTQEIALNYQSSHNLDTARTELAAVEVPNVNQWLLVTTEAAIQQQPGAVETNALVSLTLDLGLRSNQIMEYAQQANLLAVAPAPVVPAVETSRAVATNSPTVANNVANNVGDVIVPLPQGNLAGVTPDAAPVSTATPTTAALTTTLPSESAAPATATPAPTATPETQPVVRAASGINVRTGPGVVYDIAGALNAGENAQILSKNQAGDWWEVQLANGATGWVYQPLVETAGDVSQISVAVAIPTPPPTAVPAPTSAVVAAEPTAEPPAETAPAPSGPDFRVVEKRLWDVVENGGRLDGISVTCGEKRQLVVNVLDAAGNRLNGVAVQAIYGAQEIYVSGEQGKGDGTVEFVLGGGQALKVIRDADGREVSSEEVYGLSTKPWEIPYETLIGGHFCTDETSCKSFVDATGCYGHYSWTVTFQRSY